jgi:hypothetical protein
VSKSPSVTWASEPVDHDYPAAASYLTLILAPAVADAVVKRLRAQPTVTRHAKDVLRAAQLPLLPAEDPEVAKDLKRVRKGTPLSPILLVCGDAAQARPLQIADGYHRVCASYHLEEDTEIPCRIAQLPT